ncbi:MAG TPA: helix-turn-helix domain-containing protein [Minicystis sp.]|nr:helix-turn-helix domain-containing protein [Minicystis sp.]
MGYGQFCPVAQALEVFGERWTLLVIRELLMGSRRFSDLQRGVPLMSRSVLAQRLKSLRDAGVVERSGAEYELTEAGKDLGPIVVACGNWGARWARRKLNNEDVDVGLLVWDVRRRIDLAEIPDRPVLVQIDFRGAPRGKDRFFLHFKVDEVELCLNNPGCGVDLRVSTTPKAMAEVWLGRASFASALDTGAIRVEGPRELARAFPRWLELSVFAGVRPADRKGR